MGEYIREFKISSKIFGGFTIRSDIRYISNNEEIGKLVKTELLKVLNGFNLTELQEICNKKEFHIHGVNFEDILLKKDTVYICDMCKDL